jgi:HSP20 family protein
MMTEAESKEIEIKKADDKQTSLEPNKSIFKIVDPFFGRINRWIDDFWWPFETRIRFPLSLESDFRMPLTNITEEGKRYKIEAELPGIDKADINISIIDDILEIKGEGEKESKEERKGFKRREYKSSSYFRRFKLPNNLNENKITADLKNGRLEISLPKIETEKKEKKTIKIK